MPAAKSKRTRKAAPRKNTKAQAKPKRDAAKVKADREAKAKAKVEARVAAVKSGALIEAKGGVEFHRVEREDEQTVEKRAAAILADLKSSNGVPVRGKDLQAKHGGGWPQYLSIFATLKALGLVTEYRARTGQRGGAGVAYLYVG